MSKRIKRTTIGIPKEPYGLWLQAEARKRGFSSASQLVTLWCEMARNGALLERLETVERRLSALCGATGEYPVNNLKKEGAE